MHRLPDTDPEFLGTKLMVGRAKPVADTGIVDGQRRGEYAVAADGMSEGWAGQT